ncbi:MAG: Trk system potassium transporter TrkA [Spirochaeta sp.]|jgi:trk system potassium uptake protein TrkA|nr:Trk system potassium transporter TrkA [Spirochaeta sp.]
MKVVIVGAGAVGYQLAKQLISENKDVVLIEKNPDTARKVQEFLDCMVVTGEGTNHEVLRQAGTGTADYFVAATDSDEVNMIACGIVSSEFQVRAKIARVRNFDYHSSRLSEKRFLGIDFVVNPEIEAARAIMRAVDFGAVSDIMVFEQSQVQIRTIVVERDGPLSGHSLQELSHILPGTFLVAVVIRDNHYMIPSGETRLQGGDILYIVANADDFDRIFAHIGKGRHSLKRVILVGGGRIGQQVASHILGDERQTLFQRVTQRITGHEKRMLKIVDRDYQRCKTLIDRFPDALVINADISDDGAFEEQHFTNSDLVIAATENQELNIVTALYAKSLGVKRSVVLVNRAGYAPIAAQLGIDVPVSQKNAIVTTILRFIRSGAVRSIHTISDGRIEAIELTVATDSRASGRAIQDLPLPKDSLIVALERDGESLVPGGSNVIRSNDHLVVVVKKEHADKVQEIFTR